MPRDNKVGRSDMKDLRKILLVCTGNSCRSIMAEAYLEKRLKEENIPVNVGSAGTMGCDGKKPTGEVMGLLKEEGIDAGKYRSKFLTVEDLEWADLILIMGPEHRARIMEIAPGNENKIAYLGGFNPGKGEAIIPDPIGRSEAFYKASFNFIKLSVEGLIKWLKE